MKRSFYSLLVAAVGACSERSRSDRRMLLVAAVYDRRNHLRAALSGLFVGLTSLGALAQGTDNPTSVAGVFGPVSTTGCEYLPYTANATRVIPELTVAGAVGAYPLQWSRIMNSRLQVNQFLGAGGGWKHSYQWSVTADEK